MATSGAGDARQTVQAPAIALLVTGCLYALGGLGCCGSGVINFMHTPPPSSGPKSDFQKSVEEGQQYSGPTHAASGIFALVVSAVIIYGALQMKNLKSYGLAMTSSVLGMIPCSPCCLVGLPIGIWSLIVLMKPEVKSAFS
jgi:hypothetical protein